MSALPDWLSREPLGEDASVNLYEAFNDDPINNSDYLGLETISQLEERIPGRSPGPTTP